MLVDRRRASRDGRLPGGDEGADAFTDERTGDVAVVLKAEDADRLGVVPRHRQRRGLHHREIVDQRTGITQAVETTCVGVLARIGRIDAVDTVLTHEHLVAMDFERPLDGDGVGREIRHSCAGAEDDDPAFLEMPDGLQGDVGLGDLSHGDGGLHEGGLPLLLQKVL